MADRKARRGPYRAHTPRRHARPFGKVAALDAALADQAALMDDGRIEQCLRSGAANSRPVSYLATLRGVPVITLFPSVFSCTASDQTPMTQCDRRISS